MFVFSKLILLSQENVPSVKRQLGKLFEVSIRTVVPDVNVEPAVVPSAGKFGDYQWCVIGLVKMVLSF